MKRNRRSLEKLKEDLKNIKDSLIVGSRNKRTFKKEIKKRRKKVIPHEAEKNGLNGITGNEEQDIPVSSKKKRPLDLDKKSLISSIGRIEV